MDTARTESSGHQDVSELDLEFLEQHFNGDKDFKLFFLNLAITEMQKAIEQLEEYENDNTSVDLKQFLHKLKGTVSSIGLLKVAKSVAEAESITSNESEVYGLLDKVKEELIKGVKIIENLIIEG